MAEKFQAAFTTRAPRTGSWILFVIAILLLPFANGANAIALAAWLAPLFLLRFIRAQRIIVGVPLVLAVQVAALAIQYRGMVPFPTAVYVVIIITSGLLFTLPYLGDRLLSHRLSAFSGTLVFPLILTSIEYLISLGPFGSWSATAYGARLALFPPTGKTVRVATLSCVDSELHPDPKVVGRFFRHEPLTPEEIATIRERSAAIDNDLLNRSNREAKAGARIIFWGERNAPVLKQDENDLIRRGGFLAKDNGIYLGMVLASWHLETTPPLEDKIVLVQPDGTPAWEFFKAHPVPIEEEAITIRGDGKVRALDTPYGRLSSVICFDADFPQLVAQAGRLGTDLLLDPSKDWKAIDPLHTRMASFRAIEQGFNLVRHTSQGLSAAFDYQGRQLASMDHYVTIDRVLVAQVPTRGTRTVYALLGDWFAWACLVGLAGVVILGVKSRR